MPLTLSVALLHRYDTRATGITLPVALHFGAERIEFPAKLDPGSSHCIFRRQLGEQLGLVIESGVPEYFGTATGRFLTYGHEVTFSVLDLETTTMVYFADDEYFVRDVVGRTGWLDRVRLGLVDYEGRLYLSDYNDPA